MSDEKYDIVILGGGLCGLTLMYLLRESNYRVKVLEARERLGGRIFTLYEDEKAPVEMGATWLGTKHIQLNRLISELGISTFEQLIGDQAIYEAISPSPPYLAKLPPNPEPSLRIQGGSSSLIRRLADHIEEENIDLKKEVTEISEKDHGLTIRCNDETEYRTDRIVSTLPPFLFVNSVKCTPRLPSSVMEIASKTHTWMGESIKIALTYAEPFWRANHLSGTIFSNVGPIPEMYDHSSSDDNYYALKGFLNGNYWAVSKEERLEMIMLQLTKYYGAQAHDYLSYEEKVWRQDPLTYASYHQHVLPHQNNGHLIFNKTYMSDRLFLAGTETASEFPGYMEGAVVSAYHVAKKIMK